MTLDADRLRACARQMARIPVMYEQLMRVHPDGFPSLGMVAKWDRVGGFSGVTSSPTESSAMKALMLTEAQREMLRWLDAIYAVFFSLMNRDWKNRAKIQHDRKVALVLKMRVFEGKGLGQITGQCFPGIQESYVRRIYREAVELVAKEAEKRGLLNDNA